MRIFRHAQKQLGAGLYLVALLTTAECATTDKLDSDGARDQQPTTRSLRDRAGILRDASLNDDGSVNHDRLSHGAPVTISVFEDSNPALLVPGERQHPMAYRNDLERGSAAECRGNERAEGDQSLDRGFGKRIAVPRLTIIVAGALLLFPFGASTIRFIREKRTG